MRYVTLLLLLLLIVFPSCHHTRKLQRSRYAPHTAEKSKTRETITQTKEEPKKYTPESYIDTWRDVAIKQMRKYGVPASITLAQGLLESANGNSLLAREAKNHFGIKCTSDWNGGRYNKGGDCYRQYKSAQESFADHCEFLKKKRYAGLFQLRVTDYKGWARGLKDAGYATNPKYPELLINMIEKYHLDRYDR